MAEYKVLSGSDAVARGVRLARVGVIAAYPITPQTHIIERLAERVESGEMNARFIPVESEHSAMSAAMGASLAGVRSFTATASQGLLYMLEMVYWTAGARAPLVLALANRTLGPPRNIRAERTDMMATRDSGFLLFFAKNNQEALDLTIQAYKVAENRDVLLPAAVSLEGFILTHTYAGVEIPDQGIVDEFLPPYKPPVYLDPKRPLTMGNPMPPDMHHEFRIDFHKRQLKAKELIKKAAKEREKLTGRFTGDLVELYRMDDDPEIVMISMGTIAEEMEVAVDELRKEGYKVGGIRVRVFRPFPEEELRELLAGRKHAFIFTRSLSPGSIGNGGQLAIETKAALYELDKDEKPIIHDELVGLGGKDVRYSDLVKIVKGAI